MSLILPKRLLSRRAILAAGAGLISSPVIGQVGQIPSFPPKMPAPVAGGYTAQGVSFGATTTMHRGAALSGVTDSKVGMMSFWFKGATGDSSTIRVLGTSSPGPIDIVRVGGNMRLTVSNAAGTNLFQKATTSTFLFADGWKHFLASWNLATPLLQIYITDASEFSGSSGVTNDVIAYSAPADYTFPEPGLLGPFDIADFWFDPDQTPLDLSVSGNRRKFISAGLAPVDLGAAGATPTGTSPAIFFSGASASWSTNKGTGGGFSITAGSITNASSNPP